MRARRRTHRSIERSTGSQWQRDVRLLALSRGISMAGAEAGYIALLALAWQLTGSASQASLVLIAAVVARTLGAPLSGWIGDRCDRRRVIVLSEVGVAASLCGMALAQSMPQLVAACFLHSFASSTCGSALDAALASLAPRQELARANSTMGVARTAGHMVGPVLGGLAVAGFGARAAFLADAATSILAAGIVLAIGGAMGGGSRTRSSNADHDDDSSMLAGLRLLAHDPVLRLLAASWACMCVCFAFVTAAELPLSVQFGMDEPGLGMIVSSWCAGSLLGAWLSRRIHVERRGTQVLALNGLACAVIFMSAGVVPVFWGLLVLMAAGGLSMSMADVVEMTIVQQRTADAVRARVLAAYGALMSVVWGTHLAAAGLFVEAFSPGAAYVYGGVWCAISAIGFALLGRVMRRTEREQLVLSLRGRHALESELTTSA